MINVVLYCRYSSHNQTEMSIEGQRKVCLDYCNQNSYNIINEYIDRALTGTSDKRPQFQKMIADSVKRQFDYIIVYQLDRFARNRYDSATYKAKLKKNGVRVLSARENISDDASGVLMEAVLEGMAEYYSKELAQKVSRGMALNAEKCLSNGGKIPLGYCIGENKKFQIDKNNANTVKYIYQMYADGKTVTEIITHLNSQGHTTSNNVPFNKNSLRKILRNKRYCGIYTYNGIEIKDGMPRIIDDELFEEVQIIMDKNKITPARAKAKNEYILTTKLFCGYCKEMMTGYSGMGKSGTTYYYYICNGVKKKICKKKMVNKDYIENLVISECRKLLTDENIIKIANEVVAECEAEKDTTNLKRLNKLLSDNKRKHTNLMNAIMECDIENVRKSFYAEIPKLEEASTEIENEILKEQSNQVNLTVPQIKFFLSALKKGDVNDIKYRKTLVSTFINAIYLYDDKITLIFNSGDMPVTIDDILLSEIDDSNETAKCLFLNNIDSP